MLYQDPHQIETLSSAIAPGSRALLLVNNRARSAAQSLDGARAVLRDAGIEVSSLMYPAATLPTRSATPQAWTWSWWVVVTAH